jgi:hypothetical protein
VPHPTRPGRRLGGSAGGYSTLVCLTRAPERFAGGVALFGLYDLYAFGLETHRYERYYVETILGPSAENDAVWRERTARAHRRACAELDDYRAQFAAAMRAARAVFDHPPPEAAP